MWSVSNDDAGDAIFGYRGWLSVIGEEFVVLIVIVLYGNEEARFEQSLRQVIQLRWMTEAGGLFGGMARYDTNLWGQTGRFDVDE